MQGMTHEGLKKVIQFAIIFYLLQKRKTHAWIWKHERLVAFPLSDFFLQTHWFWQCWLVHGWNNAWHCQGNHYKSYGNNKFYSISCDEMTSVDNHSWLSLQTLSLTIGPKFQLWSPYKGYWKELNFGNFTIIIIFIWLLVV
jgi:hypothetical protein